MTTSRRFHTVLAIVASLAVSAPGVASAKPRRPHVPAAGVFAGVAFDGGFDGVQCDAIARFINDQFAIIRGANPNTAAGSKAIADASAAIDHALQIGTDGGCFFGGVVWA